MESYNIIMRIDKGCLVKSLREIADIIENEYPDEEDICGWDIETFSYMASID